MHRCLLQIDDVNTILLAVDVRPHAGVPQASLMAKVNACFKQVTQRYTEHNCLQGLDRVSSSISGLTTIGTVTHPTSSSTTGDMLFFRCESPHENS